MYQYSYNYISKRQVNKKIKAESNMKNFIYVSSLILIGAAIFALIEYPNSGRMGLIAGALTFIGFALNIAGFALHKKSSNNAL